MSLIKLNVEYETDNERTIRELKEKGFVEVKQNDGKPKSKNTRKAPKKDTK